MYSLLVFPTTAHPQHVLTGLSPPDPQRYNFSSSPPHALQIPPRSQHQLQATSSDPIPRVLFFPSQPLYREAAASANHAATTAETASPESNTILHVQRHSRGNPEITADQSVHSDTSKQQKLEAGLVSTKTSQIMQPSSTSQTSQRLLLLTLKEDYVISQHFNQIKATFSSHQNSGRGHCSSLLSLVTAQQGVLLSQATTSEQGRSEPSTYSSLLQHQLVLLSQHQLWDILQSKDEFDPGENSGADSGDDFGEDSGYDSREDPERKGPKFAHYMATVYQKGQLGYTFYHFIRIPNELSWPGTYAFCQKA